MTVDSVACIPRLTLTAPPQPTEETHCQTALLRVPMEIACTRKFIKKVRVKGFPPTTRLKQSPMWRALQEAITINLAQANLACGPWLRECGNSQVEHVGVPSGWPRLPHKQGLRCGCGGRLRLLARLQRCNQWRFGATTTCWIESSDQ